MAYKHFRREYFDDTRSDEDLEKAARALYKGCERHFSASVDRITNIAEVHEKEDYFRDLIATLLKSDDLSDFNETVDIIIRDIPMVEKWISWWRRPSNAAMIFPSSREMDDHLWHTIPDTTNAEEFMHWVLYCSVGNRQVGVKGVIGLLLFAESLEAIYEHRMRKWYSFSEKSLFMFHSQRAVSMTIMETILNLGEISLR